VAGSDGRGSRARWRRGLAYRPSPIREVNNLRARIALRFAGRGIDQSQHDLEQESSLVENLLRIWSIGSQLQCSISRLAILISERRKTLA
jgi:hypothetical protein